MSIKIDKERCVSCGQCIEVCPGNLIKRDPDGKSVIRRPEDCWGCTSCLKACAFHAIAFYLAEDIGGTGAVLTVQEHDSYLDWIVDRPDGSSETVSIDRRESNRY